MCCKAITEAAFKKKAKELGQIKGTALEDLLKKNPKHWCKAFFSTRCLSDSVDNNIAEAFNARIIQARHMSIVSMFEEIRHYVMGKIMSMTKAYAKWNREFCPRVCEKIEHNRELSAFCHVVWNGSKGYEVECHKDRFVVKVQERKCTCRVWELTGIPCSHAICVIIYMKENVEDFVASVYKKSVYEQCYNHVLPPLAGDKFWPDTKMGDIDPPLPRKLPGRPKRNKVREEGEASGTTRSRKGLKIRCQRCFKLGHNSRKCPAKGTSDGANADDQTHEVPVQRNEEVPVQTHEVPVQLHEVPIQINEVPIDLYEVPIELHKVPIQTHEVAVEATATYQQDEAVQASRKPTGAEKQRRRGRIGQVNADDPNPEAGGNRRKGKEKEAANVVAAGRQGRRIMQGFGDICQRENWFADFKRMHYLFYILAGLLC